MHHPNNLSLLPDEHTAPVVSSPNKQKNQQKSAKTNVNQIQKAFDEDTLTGIPLDTFNCLPHKECQSFELFNWQTDFLVENYTLYPMPLMNALGIMIVDSIFIWINEQASIIA